MWLSALALGVASSGCSVLFDTDDYRRSLVPTAPEVSIVPAQPTTLEDLTVLIDVEATDPLDEAVSYRYEWDREDGAGTSTSVVTAAQVAASATTKHDVWTVRVIPVAGGREGPAGTASVTIVNSKPVMQFARLARYEVWQDETISASALATDPDGDPTSFVYSWTLNGAPLTDTTATLSASGFEPGDELAVTISATDGDTDGDAMETRSAGPATVRAPTGWRQLEPNRGYTATTPVFFADPLRGRMLYLREGALWEYRVTGVTALRWAKLNLSGLPELYGSSVFYDAARSRFLIWGGVDYTSVPAVPTTALYELVVATPGQETFREVTTTLAPPARIAHVSLHDAERTRGIILGGGTPDPLPITFSQFHDDVWELDYSTPDPTFSLITADAATPQSWLVASTVDALGGGGYLFGGFDQTGTALDEVYLFDFETNALTSVGSLSSARGAVGAVDLGDGSALLVDGSDALIAPSTPERLERFTYATRASEPFTLSGTRPPLQGRPSLERFGDAFTWSAGLFASDLFVAIVEDGQVERLLLPHEEVPGATNYGAVIRGSGAGGGVTFGFGDVRRGLDRTISGSTFNFDGDRWALVTELSDASLARGAPSPISTPRGPAERVFGTSDAVSNSPNSSVLGIESGAWVEQRADEPALNAVLGGAPVPAWHCNDVPRVLLGNQTFVLTDGMAASPLANVASPPNVRGAIYDTLRPVDNGMGTVVDRVVVFGGSTVADWWTADPCDANDDWTSQTVVGGPSARYAPSIAKRVAIANDRTTSQLFVFGGMTQLDQTRTHLGGFWLVTMDAAGVLTAQALPSGSGPTPSPRGAAVLGWDRFRNRLVLFGGEGPGGHEFGGPSVGASRADTWEYRLPMGL